MANDFIKGGGSTVYLTLIEDAEGNELDPVVTIELPFTTEAFNPVGEFINSNAIAGGRSRGIGCLGNKAGDGSFDVELTKENFGILFYAALGAINTGVIGPSDDDLPVYDVYIRHGNDTNMIYKYESQRVGSMRISFASNAVLTASIDWSGFTWSKESSLPTATHALSAGNTILCPLALADIELDGTSILDAITGLEFTINNGLDTDTNSLNAGGRLAVIPGEFSLTGSLTFLVPKSGTLYTQLVNLDIGDKIADELAIHMAADDSDTILLQNVYATQPTHDITGREKVSFRVDFQCVQGASTDPIAVTPFAESLDPITFA
ncbi:MAG: phage tail tube protein [Clostridia bacterium]|jgi:hypothetical protein